MTDRLQQVRRVRFDLKAELHVPILTLGRSLTWVSFAPGTSSSWSSSFFVLFGYKKLPDATRSLGRSLRILKTEVKSLHDDEPETADGRQPSSRPARCRGAPCRGP